ncbi:MAG: glutamine--fructose-6-phosphate transaminase (isomerizing), partial [Candidatus Omnitrophica bacterium]|nr:glutamine--fructose-6-phosphate transaminase (isomerizing) [Candidatus Omnitrophota bacterium]
EKEAQPILLNGLTRLEYRGYDSCGGVSYLNSRKSLSVRKLSGKVKTLEQLLKRRPLGGNVALGHCRWATHGAPNRVNAHPHLDCRGEIALVHNGIIENYAQLKKELIGKGHKFRSQTDTEVIAHLIEEFYRSRPLEEAVRKAVAKLEGSFAIGVMSKKEPGKLVGVRSGSPLIVGVGKNENFLASDVPALLDYTRDIIFLEEGEIVVLTKDGFRVTDFKGIEAPKKPARINWDNSCAQKQGYRHFMLKEIYEQPRVLRQILSSYIKGDVINFGDTAISPALLKTIDNIVIVACGTAYHAGLVGEYALEELARIPVTVDLSSEFRYRTPIIGKKTLVVAISQSGETADTLAAVKEARRRQAKVLSICNVVGSSLMRESDFVLHTLAGPEIGVASTKAYTAQLTTLYLLAMHLARVKSKASPVLIRRLIKELRTIALKQEEFLQKGRDVLKVARSYHRLGSFLYLGRRINYPSALEGALKLKEISYIPAEGYAAGEMKHGPIALIDEYRAVVCIAVDSDIYEKMVSNIQEIRARSGKVVAIASETNTHIKDYAQKTIYVPKTSELFSPLLVALPLQLLAYHIAVVRGCDVDQPRNLAKSVTVE